MASIKLAAMRQIEFQSWGGIRWNSLMKLREKPLGVHCSTSFSRKCHKFLIFLFFNREFAISTSECATASMWWIFSELANALAFSRFASSGGRSHAIIGRLRTAHFTKNVNAELSNRQGCHISQMSFDGFSVPFDTELELLWMDWSADLCMCGCVCVCERSHDITHCQNSCWRINCEDCH